MPAARRRAPVTITSRTAGFAAPKESGRRSLCSAGRDEPGETDGHAPRPSPLARTPAYFAATTGMPRSDPAPFISSSARCTAALEAAGTDSRAASSRSARFTPARLASFTWP